jgi:hypothetical protein
VLSRNDAVSKDFLSIEKPVGTGLLVTGHLIMSIAIDPSPCCSYKRQQRTPVLCNNRKTAYLAAFFRFFFAALTCGEGGVRSILRSTSSRLGGGFDGWGGFMVGA